MANSVLVSSKHATGMALVADAVIRDYEQTKCVADA
jgi:hypothetical protein